MPLERLVRDRINRDLRALPELHVRHVGLVDLDLGLDDPHVRQRQQHRAGVVHRPDDGRFTFLDVAAGDDAVDWRLDALLAQVVARAFEPGALLIDPARLRRGGLVTLLQGRFRRLHVVHRPVERVARRQLLRPVLLLPRQRRLRLLQLHPRGFHRLPHLVERALRCLQ